MINRLLVAAFLIAASSQAHAQQAPDPLDVVFVSAEVKPFASTGGLGNVAQELPATFDELGQRSTVIMPLYHTIDPAAKGLTDTGITYRVGQQTVRLWKGENNGVPVYFLDNKKFFSGPRDGGIYLDAHEKDYADNPARWDFFSRASLGAVKALGLHPDVIQSNDHHSGAVSWYAKQDPYFDRTLQVFEIHNAAYQGAFDKSELGDTRLAGAPAEIYGRVNPLKLAIHSADVVLTVSPNYAKETLGWQFGSGMEDTLRKKYEAGRYIGILNGTDASWNPAKDPFIAKKYSRDSLDGKAANKAELQRMYFGDSGVNADVPIFGTVTRFTQQKGIERIIHSVTELAQSGEKFQYVILGSKDATYYPQLEALAQRYPDQVKVDTDFTIAKEHQYYAGLDGYLMPSNWEPSGLPQMYAERYGTLPIVSDVGGLKDSVKNYDPATKRGTGIVFRAEMAPTFFGMARDEYDRIVADFEQQKLDATTEGLKRAIDLFRSKDDFRQAQRNAMRQENRWTKRAGPDYLDTFRRFLDDLRGDSTLRATTRGAASMVRGVADWGRSVVRGTPPERAPSETPGMSRLLDLAQERAAESVDPAER